jgi:uncharacterized membrane protein YgdD (TMEM256/DUF423 family)
MNRKILLWSAAFGLTAIILGAFGAHILKKYLAIEQLTAFETAVKYQMYHALFLLFLSNITLITEKTRKLILNITIVGVLLFSGSIYLLATMPISGINFKPIGFTTPIGGMFLISAWAILLLKSVKNKE